MNLTREELIQDRQTALLVVDQQTDFEPGGALGCEGADQLSEPIGRLMLEFQNVVVTQDSHPEGHISFASSYSGKKPFEILTLDQVKSGTVETKLPKEAVVSYLEKTAQKCQILWPDHCIVGKPGWFLDLRLRLERAQLILRKGTRVDCDSYSAFYENDGRSTGLTGYLRDAQIKRLVIVGLCGDYCVLWSVRDARRDGFEVVFDENLTRFVDSTPEGKQRVLEEFNGLNVHTTRLVSKEFPGSSVESRRVS